MTQQSAAHNEGGDILTRIDEGMTVYDRDGHRIGTVRRVHLGAVRAQDDERGLGPATVSAGDTSEGSLLEDFARVFAPEPIPEPVRARLLRHGFVRIDATGLFAADRYALPEQIASVSGDHVTLGVTREELMKH